DPVWTADGIVSERWLPMSPVSGRLDAFEWRAPLEELAAPERAAEPEMPDIIEQPGTEQPASPALPAADAPAEPESPSAPPKPAPAAEQQKTDGAAPISPSRAEIIVPVVRAPDDPGPEPEPERESASETAGTGG